MAAAPLDLKLTVKGLPELDKLVKRMGVLEKEVNQLNGQLPKASNNIRRVGTSSRQASSGVSSLAVAISGIVSGFTAIQSLKFTIFKTAELETQTKSLKVLTGSLETAKDVIKELQDFGAVTPFTSTELIDTAKRLKAFGVDTEKLVETTKRLGDVAGATGADLSGIATAFGQIQAKGRLQGEELLQLQERGIGLQDELQKMYKLSGEEFRKALEKGRFSAEAVEVAIKRLTEAGGKYADGAIAQSDTLAGKFSTLIDGITRIAQALGKVLSPALKQILSEAIGVVNSINAAIGAARRLQQFGISAGQRNDLFRQAGEDAEQIAKLRGGGLIDPAEFTRLRDERFKDLIEAYGYDTGQIQVEIKPVLASGAETLPQLLGAAPGGNSGGGSGANAALTAQRDAEQLAQRQAEAYESINQQLDRSLALNSGVNEYMQQGLRNLFAYQDIVARINKEVDTGRQNELIALAQLQREQADFNILKAAAADFGSEVGSEFAAQIPEVNKELTKTEELLKGSFDIVSNGLTAGIQGLIQGTKDFNDVLADVLNNLANLFLNAGFSSLGAGLGIPGYADGGRPEPNKLSIVGERGPELFVPDAPGTVLTSDQAFNAARSAMGSGESIIDSDSAFAANTAALGSTTSAAAVRAERAALMSSESQPIDVRFEEVLINEMRFTTPEQTMAAVNAGVAQAKAQVFSDMRNRPATRKQVGLR